MSQNKTVVPGMEQSEATYRGGVGNYNANFYQSGGTTTRPTFVPVDGDDSAQPTDTSSFTQPTTQARPSYNAGGKPIVGFLYSVSRTATGEYWPLHQGSNTIGKSESCDIVLREGTVTLEHAKLVIQKQKNPEKLRASIADLSSSNGTMLNGNSIFLQAEECSNGDIISVGESYELYLILIDTKALGLKKAEKFMAVNSEGPVMGSGPANPNRAYNPNGPTAPGFNYGPSTSPGFNTGGSEPSSFNPGMPNHFQGADGTVGLDGSPAIGGRGGTVPSGQHTR